MSRFIKDIKLEERERKIDKEVTIIPDIESENIIKQFKNNIDNIRLKFEIYENLIGNHMEDEAKDSLRSQVVFLMSALDFYMHEIVKYCLLKIFKGERQKTKSYKSFVISIETLEKALENPESVDWLSEEIDIMHSYKTFMSYSKIQKVFSLISKKNVKNVFNEIEKNMQMKGKLSKEIKEIYDRRNKIAHQSDRNSDTAKLYNIEKEEVMRYIDIVEKMVCEMHNIIVNDI